MCISKHFHDLKRRPQSTSLSELNRANDGQKTPAKLVLKGTGRRCMNNVHGRRVGGGGRGRGGQVKSS